jgi:hypothetical protein
MEMPRDNKSWLLMAIIASLSCLILGSGTANADDFDTKVTVRTELVLIPTLVTDKSGTHVRGHPRTEKGRLQSLTEWHGTKDCDLR